MPLGGHLCAAAGVALQADVLAARTAALGGLREKGAGWSVGEAASGLRVPTLSSGGAAGLEVSKCGLISTPDSGKSFLRASTSYLSNKSGAAAHSLLPGASSEATPATGPPPPTHNQRTPPLTALHLRLPTNILVHLKGLVVCTSIFYSFPVHMLFAL